MVQHPSTGALDGQVGFDDQLSPHVDYGRPRGGGDVLFELVGDLGGRRILDFGCGLAPFRRRFEKMGAEWIGLELTGEACTVIGDGGRLPFADGSFDEVFCGAVLEHLPEPGAALAEMRRVLRTDGRVFGYVSFLEPFHGMSYFHMSHMGLEYLLLKHGFRPTHIYPSRIGMAHQLECMLFPRYLPVIQPVFRRILDWTFSALLAANRVARRIARAATRRSGAGDGNDGKRYGQLLALRFAVGFNFIAVRDESPGGGTAGYSGLVKEG